MSNVLDRFLGDIKNHEMTVEADSGVNRSILFKRKDSGTYHFRITTWKDHLCITGDMGCYVFSRVEDMFRFFRQNGLRINIGYWTEKLIADSIFGGGHKIFDPKSARQHVIDHFLTPLREDGDLEKFREVRENLESNGLLDELEEWDFYHAIQNTSLDTADLFDGWAPNKFTTRYLWCCYAIVWGIQQYDKNKRRFAEPLFE